MPDIHIPPAALEAGARAINENRRSVYSDAGLARAAFVAMVEAWPDWAMRIWPNDPSKQPHLILPIMENPDDQV